LFTDAMHVIISYLMVNRTVWGAKRGVYKLSQNPDFVA